MMTVNTPTQIDQASLQKLLMEQAAYRREHQCRYCYIEDYWPCVAVGRIVGRNKTVYFRVCERHVRFVPDWQHNVRWNPLPLRSEMLRCIRPPLLPDDETAEPKEAQ